MRYVRLIAVSDGYDSECGFAIRGVPRGDGFMADRGGVLLAHDLLEHVNRPEDIGQVWDELEALGAIWQVRGRHGDLFADRPSYHSIESNIASDISRMFPEWHWQSYNGPNADRAGQRRHDMDSYFEESIRLATKDIKSDIENGDHEPHTQNMRESLAEYLDLALRRMRVGYRKAQRRYGTGYEASNNFVAIRDAVKDARKAFELFEGQEFRLSYGRGRAEIIEVTPSE